MDKPIISLRNVSYAYPHTEVTQDPALAGISLDIDRGEFIGVVGANGSGKSTLARLLNAIQIPSSGQVLVDGLPTSDARNHDRIRETVGMVFQNPDSQIVATTVGDDIAFGLENIGVAEAEIERRVTRTAESFAISQLLEREPHWLSGGQKQRTVLAGVVALEPEVLVLDEPTSMLDPASRKQFHSLIDELWRAGQTVIYISHAVDELTAATRLIALDAGKVIYDGKPADFFADPGLLEQTSLVAPLPLRLSRATPGMGRGRPPLTIEELVAAVCG